MTSLSKALAVTLLFFTACVVRVAAPAGNYPHLNHALEELARARNHVQAAERAHAQHGTLGGHGANADRAMAAAEGEINQAVAFAQSNTVPGAVPGVVTAKPPLTALPDDVKYHNLGDARLSTERAIRNLEDAEQYHAPIGTLGGHGATAVNWCRQALGEITEAERWADTHR